MKSNIDDLSTDQHDTATQNRFLNFLNVLGIFLVLVTATTLILDPVLRTPSVRGPSDRRRSPCASNIRNLALATIQYEAHHKQYPPLYTVDKEGNRLHSWRTFLLPNLEQQQLYEVVDFSKAWDRPDNEIPREQNLSILHCPASQHQPCMTNYLAITGPNRPLQPGKAMRASDIRDGISNTIFFVEVPASAAVHWMSPNDIDIDAFLKLHEKGETTHQGGFNAAFGDGSVRFISSDTPVQQLTAMLTINGGEILESDTSR